MMELLTIICAIQPWKLFSGLAGSATIQRGREDWTMRDRNWPSRYLKTGAHVSLASLANSNSPLHCFVWKWQKGGGLYSQREKAAHSICQTSRTNGPLRTLMNRKERCLLSENSPRCQPISIFSFKDVHLNKRGRRRKQTRWGRSPSPPRRCDQSPDVSENQKGSRNIPLFKYLIWSQVQKKAKSVTYARAFKELDEFH